MTPDHSAPVAALAPAPDAAPAGAGAGPHAEKQKSLLIALVLGVAALLPGIYAAILANSLTLWTDLIRTIAETFAILLSWLTVRQVARGRTADFNYGFGKLENLASLLTAGVMVLSSGLLLMVTLERFRSPVPIEGVLLGILVTAVYAVVNSWLYLRNHRIAQREHSPIMEAQWRLFRMKLFANLTVIFPLSVAALFRAEAWAAYLDPAATLVLCGFMLYSAYSIVSLSVGDLLDRALEESVQLVILRGLTAFFDEYTAFHGVRSRRSGGTVYIELFLEFDASRPMGEVQQVIERMRVSMEGKIPGSQVVISPTTQPMR